MSRRVTTKTEIKDSEIAQSALKSAGMAFTVEAGGNIRITSGPCKNAVIDIRSGEVSGDTDFGHDQSKLGLLRQLYGEAKFKAEAFKNGTTIHHREVNKDGEVVLMCSMG